MSRDDLHYDAVLPTSLIFNPYIIPNAKLFYAVIRNLCRKEGYCYAGDEYLANLMGVKEVTIQQWLSDLEYQKYITRDTQVVNFIKKRKIYLNYDFQNFIDGIPPKEENSNNFTETKEKHSSDTKEKHSSDTKEKHRYKEDSKSKEDSKKNEDSKKKKEEYIGSKSETSQNASCASKDLPAPSAEASELLHFFISSIRKRNPRFKDPNLKKWASDMDKILRIDKRDLQEAKDLIEWSEGHKFWGCACLSPEKLRAKYDEMWMQKNQTIIDKPKVDNFGRKIDEQYLNLW